MARLHLASRIGGLSEEFACQFPTLSPRLRHGKSLGFQKMTSPNWDLWPHLQRDACFRALHVPAPAMDLIFPIQMYPTELQIGVDDAFVERLLDAFLAPYAMTA